MAIMKKGMKIILISILIIMLGGLGTYIYLYDVFNPNSLDTWQSFQINDLEVDSFCFFLQYDSYADQESAVDDLLDKPFRLYILDMYFDESAWSKKNIDSLMFGNDSVQDRVILSYISIGEAESYRPYWNNSWDADVDGIPDENAPDWLDQENPDWEGNYKVKFWEPGWQSIIFGSNSSYLDQIINLGFDGAYLDIIDAFEYYEEKGLANAADLMVDYVVNISTYAKSKNPDFLIVPQNGEALGVYSDYIDAVDGIGREDVFFTGNGKNSVVEINETTTFLEIFKENGKFVLNIEYPTFPRFQREAYELGTTHGYITYVAPRALDEIWVWKR